MTAGILREFAGSPPKLIPQLGPQLALQFLAEEVEVVPIPLEALHVLHVGRGGGRVAGPHDFVDEDVVVVGMGSRGGIATEGRWFVVEGGDEVKTHGA